MDEALWGLLTAAVPVTAICVQRIYWGAAPQNAKLPYVVMHVVGGSDAPHLQGMDGLWTHRVQIDSLAATRPQAVSLSRAVVGALNGYGAANDNGIRGAFIDSTREDIEDAALGRPSRVSTDFIIKWRG
jgi:hypothetical protein